MGRVVIRIVACLLIAAISVASSALADPVDSLPLPDTSLSYAIDVSVDPRTSTYAGTEVLSFTNRSDAVITAVPIHLYLNGFSNGSSTFADERGIGRFNSVWGYTEPVSITQRVAGGGPTAQRGADGETSDVSIAPTGENVSRVLADWAPVAPDDGNPYDRSLVEVTLPEPVGPGETLVLDIAFEGALPTPARARTGCVVGMTFCFFGQWYPQLGYFQASPHDAQVAGTFDYGQFHGPTEFFNNFADFEVTIEAPADLVIGATGRKVSETEDAGFRRVTHRQDAVTNFAFLVADAARYDYRYQPAGGGPAVDVTLIAPDGFAFRPERAKEAINGSFDVLGRRVGPYPYQTLTVIYPPLTNGGGAIGGMEYPTLFTGLGVDPIFEVPLWRDYKLFELVDIHEFGHMYFQGVLATNERDDAFMDEGFNTYWEYEILDDLYGESSSHGSFFGRSVNNVQTLEKDLTGFNEQVGEALAKQPSWLFEPGTGGSQIYRRPGITLRTAKNIFGRDVMDAVFQEYYARWAFNHPRTEDFLAVAGEVGGADVEAFLREAFFQPTAPDYSIASAVTAPVRVPPGTYRSQAGQAVAAPSLDEWLERKGVLGAPLTVIVKDPGWADPSGRTRRGAIGRRQLDILAQGNADDKDTVFLTEVRVTGSGWQHLPAEVRFSFADGTVAQDVWDGRAAWQAYEIYTRAPLTKVEIDPDAKIVIDADPADDFRVLVPDAAVEAEARGWGAAIGTLFGILINGAATWL